MCVRRYEEQLYFTGYFTSSIVKLCVSFCAFSTHSHFRVLNLLQGLLELANSKVVYCVLNRNQQKLYKIAVDLSIVYDFIQVFKVAPFLI